MTGAITTSDTYDNILLSSSNSSSNTVSLSSSSVGVLNLSPSKMTILEIKSPLEVQYSIEHEYIGSMGPNKRESDGILRALDWLTEKRSPNYGWANDTHMVILAKEVS